MLGRADGYLSPACEAGRRGADPDERARRTNDAQIPDDVKEQLRATHPIPRLGTPDDVADAALFLASDRSAWISGTVTDIAGGAVLA